MEESPGMPLLAPCSRHCMGAVRTWGSSPSQISRLSKISPPPPHTQVLSVECSAQLRGRGGGEGGAWPSSQEFSGNAHFVVVFFPVFSHQCQKFGQYNKEDPMSFRLSDSFSLYPQVSNTC